MAEPEWVTKERYNGQVYDRIQFVVPKGQREEIKAYAEAHGESVGGMIKRLLDAEMKKVGRE